MTRRLGPLAAAGLLLAIPAWAGNPDRGEMLYQARCIACHALEENGAGPMHKGLFGCQAGTQPGYGYSQALTTSGLVWNEQTLDRWLENPSALVPGNKMVVQLASDPKDRADLVTYLSRVTRGAGECRKPGGR
jgi:cytochrome c